MKIKSLSVENNKVIGNIFLKFTNDDNNVIDTVIFAGENGCGKSTILNIIYEFSNFNLLSEKSEEKRIFVIQVTDDDINLLLNYDQSKAYFSKGILDNELTFSFDFSILESWDQIKVEYKDLENNERSISSSIFTSPRMRPVTKALFSDVEINFEANNINYVTAKDLDQDVNNSIKTTSNLATEVTQLLIDVQALDAQEFSDWGQANIGLPVEACKLDVRMGRFKEAFNYMFSNIKYKGVKSVNNFKKIIFEQYGKEVSIDNLSSGEKQIIFRGGFLLKDQKSSKGALVLIDEPEISLHPRWQLKILNFYKKLFTDNKGVQTSQLFIVTHSPFIIHNVSRKNDKTIVLVRDVNGTTMIQDNPSYFGWTYEETIEKAFSINLSFDPKKTIVFVEGETDEMYLNKASEIFNKSYLDIEFKWVGRTCSKGKIEFTGDTALNQVKSFILANPDIINQKIILLYDSDTNKPDEQFNNLFVTRMPLNSSNNLYKIGVENLLELPSDFNKEQFYKETKKINNYGAESIIKDLDKTNLCNWLCNGVDVEVQSQYFKNFIQIFKMIEEIRNK